MTTWKGSRRQQHAEYRAIPSSRKLEIIEEMNRFALGTIEQRRAEGLPYIDPYNTNVRTPAGGARGRVRC